MSGFNISTELFNIHEEKLIRIIEETRKKRFVKPISLSFKTQFDDRIGTLTIFNVHNDNVHESKLCIKITIYLYKNGFIEEFNNMSCYTPSTKSVDICRNIINYTKKTFNKQPLTQDQKPKRVFRKDQKPRKTYSLKPEEPTTVIEHVNERVAPIEHEQDVSKTPIVNNTANNTRSFDWSEIDD